MFSHVCFKNIYLKFQIRNTITYCVLFFLFFLCQYADRYIPLWLHPSLRTSAIYVAMNDEVIKNTMKEWYNFFFYLTLENSLQDFLLHIKFESFWEVFLQFQSFGRNNDSIRVLKNRDDYFMIMILHAWDAALILHLDATFLFSKFQELSMTLYYTWFLQVPYPKTSSLLVEMGKLFERNSYTSTRWKTWQNEHYQKQSGRKPEILIYKFK